MLLISEQHELGVVERHEVDAAELNMGIGVYYRWWCDLCHAHDTSMSKQASVQRLAAHEHTLEPFCILRPTGRCDLCNAERPGI